MVSRRQYKGVFRLDDDFYARSGGISERSPNYEALLARR